MSASSTTSFLFSYPPYPPMWLDLMAVLEEIYGEEEEKRRRELKRSTVLSLKRGFFH